MVAPAGLLAAGIGAQAVGSFFQARAQDKAARAAQAAFGKSLGQLAFEDDLFKEMKADLGRKRAIIEAVDPALILAGKNLEALMAGRESPTLAPLRGEIARARASLRRDLQQRLGAGFETSTAGSQALNEFERQSQLALSSAQQQRIGLIGQIAQRPEIGGGNTANILGVQNAARANAADIAALGQMGNLTRGGILGSAGQSLTSIGTLGAIFGKNGMFAKNTGDGTTGGGSSGGGTLKSNDASGGNIMFG
jgi:hypothetical protein